MSCLASLRDLAIPFGLDDGQVDPGRGTRGDHRVAFGDGRRHRLLGEDVLARRRGLERQFARRSWSGVARTTACTSSLASRARPMAPPAHRIPRPGPPPAAPRDGDQPGPADVMGDRLGVGQAHEPAADHADADGVH